MWLNQLVFFVTLLIATTSYALDVTLEWDANEEPEVIGYSIYGQIVPDDEHEAIPEFTLLEDVVGRENTTITLRDLGDYAWCFVVTAFSVDQESGYSNKACTDNYLEEGEGQDSNRNSEGEGCFIQTLKGDFKYASSKR